MRPKLTYANVVATLALFIAIGGASAFAASQLGKNSVGTKQIKKNAVTTKKIKKEAVTGAKVKNGSLTGKQIDEATLGSVPEARRAASAGEAEKAQQADTLAPTEDWHFVGTPGQPQFQNGCKALKPVGFFKDHEGIVHVEGAYNQCASTGDTAFQLPPGFRPGQLQQFPVLGSSGAAIAVAGSEGPAQFQGRVGCGVSACFLDGVTFRAES